MPGHMCFRSHNFSVRFFVFVLNCRFELLLLIFKKYLQAIAIVFVFPMLVHGHTTIFHAIAFSNKIRQMETSEIFFDDKKTKRKLLGFVWNFNKEILKKGKIITKERRKKVPNRALSK